MSLARILESRRWQDGKNRLTRQSTRMLRDEAAQRR
jgi:hypothetical protein